MADAQVWTVIALLASCFVMLFIDLHRRVSRCPDRDGDSLRNLRSEIADVRTDLRRHVGHDHRPSA